MDLDLEIISEEAVRPDPLFDSIMNAMNSMKEATADKIYQRIQKEGATNYSKPQLALQVDRALASALKYGIFEVRNNRYRVRDDVLDDEDTVYWKLQKKREQTPFRIQDEVHERQNGLKLDPERDNQRFRRPVKKSLECPHCGRTKRLEGEEETARPRKTTKQASSQKRQPKNVKSKNHNSTAHINVPKRRTERKRKKQLDLEGGKSSKRRKPSATKENNFATANARGYCSEDKLRDYLRSEKFEYHEGTSDSSDSEMKLLSVAQHKPKSYREKNKTNFRHRNKEPSAFSSECIKVDPEVMKSKGSSTSIKTESESEKTYISSASDDLSQSRIADGFFEERPCTSRNASGKVRNQYLQSTEMYRDQYKKGQTDQGKGNPDWLGCSDEPQGAIIQSNNVLTIEPVDSLAFKNPEPASYIS